MVGLLLALRHCVHASSRFRRNGSTSGCLSNWPSDLLQEPELKRHLKQRKACRGYSHSHIEAHAQGGGAPAHGEVANIALGFMVEKNVDMSLTEKETNLELGGTPKYKKIYIPWIHPSGVHNGHPHHLMGSTMKTIRPPESFTWLSLFPRKVSRKIPVKNPCQSSLNHHKSIINPS